MQVQVHEESPDTCSLPGDVPLSTSLRGALRCAVEVLLSNSWTTKAFVQVTTSNTFQPVPASEGDILNHVGRPTCLGAGPIPMIRRAHFVETLMFAISSCALLPEDFSKVVATWEGRLSENSNNVAEQKLVASSKPVLIQRGLG